MLGQRLKQLRGKQTQEEIATKLGISRARYSHYENERSEPDTDTLQRLADIFGTSTDFIIGRTDDPSPANKKDNSHEIDDPNLNIFFKDFASAPDEKRRQLMDIWEVIKGDQATRKPGDKQGE